MRRNPNNETAAFTLLELLLTLSLFSVVLALSLNAFYQFDNQNKIVDSMVELRQEARILERMIRQDINAVVFLHEFVAFNKKSPDAAEERKSGLIGIDEQYGELERDILHMHVNRSSRFYRYLTSEDDPEIYEVSYYLETEQDDRVMLRRREEFYVDADMTDGDESITHTVSENVVSLDVKYFMKTEDPVDEWDSTETSLESKAYLGIPEGVKVSLILKNDSGAEYRKVFQINLRPALGSGIQWN